MNNYDDNKNDYEEYNEEYQQEQKKYDEYLNKMKEFGKKQLNDKSNQKALTTVIVMGMFALLSNLTKRNRRM